MRPIRSISVHMPTYQGMEFLERVMTALLAQEIDLPWDFLAIDSGSTDGTREYLEGLAPTAPIPFRVQGIHSVEFDHGDTRNLMASRSEGDLLVFLTQDAIPSGPTWLATLVRNFEDERVGAAYCRNVPRPDALPSTKILSSTDPGYATERVVQKAPANFAELSPDEKRLLYNFNDVASAVRRELWVRHPFPRTNFGEDVLMARALIEAGLHVVYDAEATVEHSHDYNAEQMRARGRIDGSFNAQWLDRVCLPSQGDVEFLLKRCAGEDRAAVEALGLPAGEAQALRQELAELRRALFEGLCEGSQDPLRRAESRLPEPGPLRLLYVVHGFPPETWAGTEIYTLNLAKGMAALGHEVTILTRSPGQPGKENFSLHRDDFEGLKVWRMVHHLAHRNLRDSFVDERAEAVFRRVLAAAQPDVVHFQHLIHGSVGNVAIAQASGAATIVTCHDFWGLCARVQMIRPDGKRCDHPMGAGCFACIKDKDSNTIERMARMNERTLGRAAQMARWIAGPRREVGRKAEEYLHMREREKVVMEAYAACDLRISPSRFLRQMYLDHGNFDPHAFLFSDNGMRTDHVAALEKTRRPGDPIRFGFVGSLVWYKGGEPLVQAMALLRDQPVELNVYGTFDPENDAHHRELQALAEGSAVTFHGRFDNSKLAEVYAKIDVLVVPSVWFENSPITIHEAHLTHTPVLASDIGGMAEYVRDGVDGLHFRVGDAQDLAAKMRRFVDEPGLLEELSQDFPELKTLDQNVRETQFRYRALANRVRTVGGTAGPLVWRGMQHEGSSGAIDRQGEDLALLRPGAWVSYPIPMQGPGVLSVELLFLQEEPDLEQAGRIWVGDETVASLMPRRGRGRTEIHRIQIDVSAAGQPQQVRIDTTHFEDGPSSVLRIEQVTWQARA